MAEWTTAPPDNDQRAPYRVIRTNHMKPLRGVILSQHLVGIMLHYWKGRSKPCEGNECEACQAGQKPRWKGYFQVHNADNQTVYIVEITERVWHEFNEEDRKNGTLRGARIELQRTNRKANGPLAARFLAGRTAESELGKEVAIVPILERMWEITGQVGPAEDAKGTEGEPNHLKMQA